MNELIKINPSVDAVTRPIVEMMTNIHLAQQQNPMISSTNEPEAVKEAKKLCVHYIFDQATGYQIKAKKTPDGKLICEACGREIYTKFDKSAVDILLEANKVVNMVLFFGMVNGLKAEPISTLISLKKTLPSVAQLCSELNEYVKKENILGDSENNIGIEYAKGNSQFRSITSL